MKFIKGIFNEETGVSTVILKDKQNNLYKGKAYLHPDDKPYASQFAGCRLAEYRAWIKYYQYQRRIKKYQLQALENLGKDIKDCSFLDLKFKHTFWTHIKNYHKEIKEYENNIKELKKLIKNTL